MCGNSTDPSGTILHLQRLSTEDGPGLRTTVFFKGCPLRCRWCHNPESISMEAQVQWLENRCIGCGSCVEACPRGALSRGTDGVVRDRARCAACGDCVRACPANAMELLGQRIGAPALVVELLKDRAFFARSGGGVTLSGGEPSLQPDYSAAVIAGLKAAGVPVALDTCGLCSRETLARLLSEVDVVLYDLKLIDSAEHAVWTGQPNERILANLRFTAERMREQDRPAALWVRTPLIPGATTSRANIQGIGAFLAEQIGAALHRWELCAFNNLCRDKYRRLDLDWDFGDTPLLRRAELDEIEAWAKSCGLDPRLISVSGAAQD